jgi:hypothetical protein
MKRKIYEPVTEFERATSYCPLYLAWRIVDEARDYFRTPIPEAFADKLARRAKAVFARHPFWARKASPRAGSCKAAPRAGSQQQFQCWRQREFILKFVRHWLAGVLAKERPALFRQLPESFKVGHPLPQKMAGSYRRDDREQQTPRRCVPTRSKFVHGCELLAN